MRLLERLSDDLFVLTKDFVDNAPAYAILSHTWGTDDEEITFDDIVEQGGKDKVGYTKLQFCARQVAIDGLRFFWIDTCCINRSSSAELAEAINSMFHWYHEAAKCYVYLSDISTYNQDESTYQPQSELAFSNSRWFTRGWTLQELLAPTSLEFFSADGQRIGDKRSLEQQINEITGIPLEALRGRPLSDFSVAERLSWAAKRNTTLKEDKAYCLLGIFDIYMPMIYGEGEKAFKRLEEEINKSSKGKDDAIDRDNGFSTVHLGKQLTEIQQLIVETHNAVLSQNKLRNPHSSSPNFRGGIAMIDQRFLLSSQPSGDPSFSIGMANTFSTSSFPPELMSPFQMLPGPYLEVYATNQRLPVSSLVVTHYHHESCSAQETRNIYQVLYLKSPRQWNRLNIAITVHRSSTYWAATKLSGSTYSTKHTLPFVGLASLPNSLLARIQSFFEGVSNLEDEMYFSFHLTNKELVQQSYCQSRAHSYTMALQPSSSCCGIIASLDDMGCPKYFEKELIQVAMVQSPDHFVACLNGSFVLEVKFTSSPPSYEQLYAIQVLHCMKNTPGFAQLVGVVVDSSGSRLRSYLIGPLKEGLRYLSDEVVQSQLIPWRQRERWAWQLVKAVQQAHSNGFVIDSLSNIRPFILVDACNRLYIWKFQKKFTLGYVLGCYYPPEFSHLKHAPRTTTEADCPNTTPKTDIFHLGKVLWCIAEGFPTRHPSPACMRENCWTQPPYSCSFESHIDPISLPQLSEDIPQYYRSIVDDCRAQDPNDRPAAWRLLDRFPCSVSSEYPKAEVAESESLDPGYWSKLFRRRVACDKCLGFIEGSYFHCNVCHAGDFDICLRCYNHGLHCYERDHLLVEMVVEVLQSFSARKYHSAADLNSGLRIVTEL